MVSPDLLTHIERALLDVCHAACTRLPPEGQELVAPMIIAVAEDGTQQVCLLPQIEARMAALTHFAQQPKVSALVLMYDGYVTVIPKTEGVTLENVDAYRASAAFPRQDAIMILTLQRATPFQFTIHTYRYIRAEGQAVLDPVPEIVTLSPETAPDNDYWQVFGLDLERSSPSGPDLDLPRRAG